MKNIPFIIPKDISSVITEGEIVKDHLNIKLNNSFRDVYPTTKRLIIKHNESLKDIDFRHISSIELGTRRDWTYIFVGVSGSAILLFSPNMMERLTYIGTLIFFGISIAFIYQGIKRKASFLKFQVGESQSFEFEGTPDILNTLSKYIRVEGQ